jgi:hypothetical protein
MVPNPRYPNTLCLVNLGGGTCTQTVPGAFSTVFVAPLAHTHPWHTFHHVLDPQDIKRLLLQSAMHPAFLHKPEGRKFVAGIFAMDLSLVRDLTAVIKNQVCAVLLRTIFYFQWFTCLLRPHARTHTHTLTYTHTYIHLHTQHTQTHIYTDIHTHTHKIRAVQGHVCALKFDCPLHLSRIQNNTKHIIIPKPKP